MWQALLKDSKFVTMSSCRDVCWQVYAVPNAQSVLLEQPNAFIDAVPLQYGLHGLTWPLQHTHCCFDHTLFRKGRCCDVQAFARLSAVYGGTYMLAKPDVEVVFENGVAVGISSEGETAKAKLVGCTCCCCMAPAKPFLHLRCTCKISGIEDHWRRCCLLDVLLERLSTAVDGTCRTCSELVFCTVQLLHRQ